MREIRTDESDMLLNTQLSGPAMEDGSEEAGGRSNLAEQLLR
ncbi:hypothetical protein [Deinococcus soli (ex Cha et al. 2016)]